MRKLNFSLGEMLMAVTITNRASLSYTSNGVVNTALSNIASTVLQGPLNITKAVMESAYTGDDTLTYILTVENTGTAPLNNVTVTDDLGTYTFTEAGGTAAALTPLSYAGPSRYYINGVYSGELTPAVNANSLVYSIQSLPAQSNAMILADLSTNGFAPIEAGGSITNTATATADGITEPAEATAVLPAAERADVRIVKTMTPNPVVEGSPLTYTFTIYNYGNAPAENIVLTDTFDPAPAAPLTIAVDGIALADAAGTYNGGTFTLPANGTAPVSIPAATVTRAPDGSVSVTPGVTEITVTGII